MRPRVPRVLFVAIVVAVMVLPYAAMFAPASAAKIKLKYHITTYIDPVFRSKLFWKKGILATQHFLDPMPGFAEKLAEHAHLVIKRPSEPYARALLLLPLSATTKQIIRLSKYMIITGVYPTSEYYIVAGWVTPASINKIAGLGFVAAILPDIRVDEMLASSHGMAIPLYKISKSEAEKMLKELLEGGKLAATELLANGKEPTIPSKAVKRLAEKKPSLHSMTSTEDDELGRIFYAVNITKAVNVWLEYGDLGQDTTIAIIDTGVDYASPALGLGAIARDKHGIPLILDSDEYGLVLTPLKAAPINSSYIYVNVSKLYFFMPPMYVIKYDKGFAYINGCWVFYNLSDYWRVPVNVTESPVPPRFGLAVRVLYTPIGIIAFTVPAIIYGNNNGYYNTVLLDMKLAYYYLYKAANECGITSYFPKPPIKEPVYSFTGEPAIRYGHEIAALDLNGDGYYDFSVGTLSGFVNDALGIILYQEKGLLDKVMSQLQEGSGISMPLLWDTWTFESLGYIWPGMDIWNGQYFDLEYDYFGHGTFCATTAAGRPVYAYTGYGSIDNGWSIVTGQAPEAKIAAASALWLGNVLTSIYFFSGFDEKTAYGASYFIEPVPGTQNPWTNFTGGIWIWTYTGKHQVDITSNSYGISAWALWGWSSGMDPISVAIDYISSVSGTADFIAAGNGGPGWGTVTVPGASTMAITVGAATDFAFLSMYGIAPGGNKEIISWSDRGPAETLIPKPDIAAIGGFTFAVGRPWDSLAWGQLNGFLSFNVFGGTSEATPMAAGVAALVVTMYKELHNGAKMPAYLLKTILMNSADNTGFDAFSQGAGFINAFKAVQLVQGRGTIVYNKDFMKVYRELIGNDVSTFTYGVHSAAKIHWYEPVMVFAPNLGLKRETLVIRGNGLYHVYAVKPVMVFSHSLCGAPGVTPSARCINGKLLLDFGKMGSSDFKILAIINPSFYERFGLIEIDMAYPFKYFNTSGRYTSYHGGIIYNGLELWAWIDLNHDGRIEPNEITLLQYDIRGANSFHIQVADLKKQIAEAKKLIGIYNGVNVENDPVKLVLAYRIIGNYWSGTDTKTLALVRIEGYKFTQWFGVMPWSPFIYARGTAYLPVEVFRAPIKGVEEGYIIVENIINHNKILVPTIVVNAYKLSSMSSSVTINYRRYGWIDGRNLYQNYLLRGVFDYTWRYESGDWRVFPLIVTNPHIKYLLVELWWPVPNKNYASNLDIQVYGPYKYYMVMLGEGTYRDSNGAQLYPVEEMIVHGLQLGAKLTLDFRMFFDEPTPGYARIVVPLSGPGLYRIVVRNIQFSGYSLEEPFTIKVTPIAARIYPQPLYLPRGSGTDIQVLLYMPTRLSHPSLTITSTNEFLKQIGSRLYYGGPSVFSKYFYATTLNTFTISYWHTTILVAGLYVKAKWSATTGHYKLLYAMSIAGIPVTSVGNTCCGSTSYFLYWSILPLGITAMVR